MTGNTIQLIGDGGRDVLDTEDAPLRLGIDDRVAEALGGERLRLEVVAAPGVARAMRARLAAL